MMKTFRISLLALLFATAFPALLSAQNLTVKNSTFSLQIGPSRYVGKLLGITDYSKDFRNSLRTGFTWSAGYGYLFGRKEWRCRFGLGVLYQGTAYSHEAAETSDDIGLHYVAPQFTLHIGQERYNIQLIYGTGILWYTDDSRVYGKPRKVDMDGTAFNLSLGGEYYLNAWCGICARLNWLVSESHAYSVAYHGETWTVGDPERSGGGGVLAPCSLGVGLNFHF